MEIIIMISVLPILSIVSVSALVGYMNGLGWKFSRLTQCSWVGYMRHVRN